MAKSKAKRYERYPFTITQDGVQARNGFILEFDLYLNRGTDRVTQHLTEIGAEMIKVALATMPVTVLNNSFWGYKSTPKKACLCNAEPARPGDELVYLRSKDRKALEAIADVLADERCWSPNLPPRKITDDTHTFYK